MTTAKKNVKNFILQGNMAKGITVIENQSIIFSLK